MSYTIADIARALGAEVAGDTSLRIDAAREPADAGPDDLALAMDPKYAEKLGQGRARCALLWPGADWQSMGLKAAVFVGRPRMAMAGVTALLDPGPVIEKGIHPTAVVDPSARIGANAAIGPLCVIEADVIIGNNARIGPGCHLARGGCFGDDLLLYGRAHFGANVQVGHRFVGQVGCVVGSDGLAFTTAEKNAVEKARESLGQAEVGDDAGQSWVRLHSLGRVEIGDDVEIGANSCVDRGTIRATRIGSGTKVDNLVHIAHNVEIGRDCLFAAQVGIAGSTRIGNHVVFGGQVGVGDNITVGDGVVAGGATKILSKVPAGRTMLGYPAVRMDQHLAMYKALRRLPRVLGDLAAREKHVSNGDDKD